jgi:uncharacterized protein YqgC (DUF456 family)
MIVGLLGVILPVVPGVGFIWIIALIYAIAERFATIDPITFTVLTLLGAAGVSADLWMSQVGAKAGGASLASMLAGAVLAAIGAIVGLFFLGIGAIPGAIIGAILGVFAAEWYRHKDWREAFKASGGWLVGCTLSGGVQFLIAILMMLIFTGQVFRG